MQLQDVEDLKQQLKQLMLLSKSHITLHIITEATQVAGQAATKAMMDTVYGSHTSFPPRNCSQKSIDSQTLSR